MAEPLLAVDEALARILASVEAPLPAETCALAVAAGRTLAAPLAAQRTQPPFPASAMDGYAVRAADIASPPATLRLIGASAAGHGFRGALGPGEAVRIFTGAPVPEGADTILIQENARRDGEAVIAHESERAGRYIRPAGIDFGEGALLLRAGTRLGPRELTLAAAMGHAALPLVRRPRVAVLATGDELRAPGEPTGPDEIICSNSFGVMAIAQAAGAEAIDLGIAADREEALDAAFERAAGADVLVTIGGASVGEHDLVRAVAARRGAALAFYRIAMRPGKPLNFGRLGETRLLGLPGNPVSSIVCSLLFLRPLVRALCGDPAPSAMPFRRARLATPLSANDLRQDYLRTRLAESDGMLVATPLPNQDSSLMNPLATADGLLVRAPHAPAAAAGDLCEVLTFRDLQA